MGRYDDVDDEEDDFDVDDDEEEDKDVDYGGCVIFDSVTYDGGFYYVMRLE